MRVLMIAPTSFFSDYGGHIRILEEMRALNERGLETAVVTYYKGNDLAGIDIRRTPPLPWHTDYEVGASRHKIAFDAYLLAQSLLEARRYAPDIIHGHMHEGALIGGVLSRIFRVPLVFDFQGSLTAEMVDHRFLRPDGTLFRWTYRLESFITRRLPDAILTSTGRAGTLLQDDFRVPSDRIYSLPDCADVEHFDPERFASLPSPHPIRRQLGIAEDAFVVGYLGLLTDYQGIPHLISAAAKLRGRGEPSHFLIMGFPNVDHYQALARSAGVADSMTFTGRVPFEDAPYYLSACDLFAAPKVSTTEGSGKLLNYMAMARPIVAYDTPVNREYLDDLGVFAPPGDIDALTDVIVALGRDPELRAALGARLRQRAGETFSWAAAADRIHTVYQSLTNRK